MRLTHRLACALAVVCALAAPASADSISPYRRADLRALSQSADVIVVARIGRVDPGQRGGLVGGRMVETTDTKARATIRSVLVGDASLQGSTIEVRFTAADDPITLPAPDPLLLFLAREGNDYRLCFAELYGAIPVRNGDVQIWLEGTEHGTTPALTSLGPEIARWATARVRVTPTATVVGPNVVVRYELSNVGAQRVRVVPPSWVFDAVWSYAVQPGTNQRLSGDWAGVGHWRSVHARERMRTLAPGRSTTFTYRIRRTTLQMEQPGEYVLGLRYQPFRPSDWSPASNGRPYPADAFLGVPTETTVHVVVPVSP